MQTQKKKEIIGSDVSVIFDQENFGVAKENDPRFVANQFFMSKCQYRKYVLCC